MALSLLSIHNLRNIQAATLELSPRLNLIIGANGSGKTSLLEAIYLLGRGKSFRSAYSRKIVQHDQVELTVFGKTDLLGNNHSLGIQIREGRFRAKIDGGYEKKSSVLASHLPLLLISPDGDKLIKGSPRQRRRFIDWGLFHVKQEFLTVWQRYNRVLQQRNTLLRQKKSSQLETWDTQLIAIALQLDEFRSDYITALAAAAQGYLSRLLDLAPVEFGYRSGWPAGENFQSALTENINSDLKAGFTQRGPHRADLVMRVGGHPAAEVLSGGQQKLAACALLLAQAAVFNQFRQESCLILVDDLPAELDSSHRQMLMDLLYSLAGQLVVTTTSRSLLEISRYPEQKMFHVKQGVFIPVEEGDGN